ncbi:sulfotransferase [Calothrix sp. CCY 0018]|uniref:sulfotransferase n=1 Tax=Calothrix sp. CCY 0018 TaxID=3103864 RepID=UPI0039C7600A
MTSISVDNNVIPDTPYLDLLDKVSFNPIFIMGDHRSGTTLLYQTLAATGCFNFVEAYHIIKYDEILSNHINQTENQAIKELEKLFASQGISDRRVDKVMATPNLTEEYGFILKKVDGERLCIAPENLPIFQQLCRKIQFVSDLDKLLLLKNPWDFSQFMYVNSVVPNAKYIFIHRNPIHVINSKLKAARSLFASYSPYNALLDKSYSELFKKPAKLFSCRIRNSKWFNLGLEQYLKQSIRFSDYFLENIESLSEKNYLSLRYQDLCEAPEVNIHRILEFLSLEPRVTLDYQKLIQPRPIELLPEVKKHRKQITEKLQPYFAYHGFDC